MRLDAYVLGGELAETMVGGCLLNSAINESRTDERLELIVQLASCSVQPSAEHSEAFLAQVPGRQLNQTTTAYGLKVLDHALGADKRVTHDGRHVAWQ